ncbi:TetR/AcrR family transcriptional regulator [Sinomonas sp. ASV486]|uniref:TetR/AcrR family transcriptional regulator n=1 Tax=Sinomonas puerhi TaxID=3238584 RepID=A0AB39L9P5_9MICC|nr:TetR/AcrR family transcriptional regulator [Sinomonas sp. ASV486]MDQ4489782.1 TetR/AcrR family transcriptional regulator [Sinomonas sp. ASV486]
MGRWAENPRGRLAAAAFELYGEQGFEQTTGAQIATRAGMHERSFFRLFGDKREVFFYAMDGVAHELAASIAGSATDATPIDAASDAIEERCALIQRSPSLAALRARLIAENPELRERDLSKHAELAMAVAGALRERGTAEHIAVLIGETTIAAFRTAVARWISDPATRSLPERFRDGLDDLEAALVHRRRGPARDPRTPHS